MRKFGAFVLPAAVAAFLWPSLSLAQRAVIVVRHADKVSDSDERLSEAGRARATRLAAVLKDLGVTAIYSTDTERAKDTVQPLADATKLPVRVYDLPKSARGKGVDAKPFVSRIRQEQTGGIPVVVGHSNTLPAIIQAFGTGIEVTVGPSDYDDLFIVIPTGKRATLLKLKY